MFNKKQITKKDFYSMDILDRIEYRQRMDLIEKSKVETGAWSFLKVVFCMIGFAMLFALGVYNISPDSVVKVLNLIPLIFGLGFAMFICLWILDLFFSYLTSKKRKELINEYFPLEIKKKGVNNVRKK